LSFSGYIKNIVCLAVLDLTTPGTGMEQKMKDGMKHSSCTLYSTYLPMPVVVFENLSSDHVHGSWFAMIMTQIDA